MQNFSATHLIPAVEMEVRETKRKAKVGEPIRVLSGPYASQLSSHLVRVTGEAYGAVKVQTPQGDTVQVRHEHYTVMEPTGIMVVDGIRYVPEAAYKELEKAKEKAVKEAYESGKSITELLTVTTPKPKNRNDIIAEAKKDVEDLTNAYAHARKFIFQGNPETGVVTCIVSRKDGKLLRTGTAKCAPEDQFDLFIGRAIATRRALKLAVPDQYINAPQFPTSKGFGM